MADPGPRAAPEELVGERIAGRFLVDKLIGDGPLSTAFRAHDERLRRRVTVKLFHPRHRDDVQVVDAQLAAARAVARLSHEHIAMVIDRGEHEGMPLVVLEYVRGENLLERIERYAPLALPEVVGYGLQIARALTYAHGQGVVHGNLRPENVLLTEDREVKLVDFGGGSYVAQLVGDPYAAPELREVDATAPPVPTDDVYALGALLFVALTERTPPPGIMPADVQLLRPDAPARLAESIARALAHDPDDRHASMRELAAELASVHESRDAARERRAMVAAQDTRAMSAVDGFGADGAFEQDDAAEGTSVLPRGGSTEDADESTRDAGAVVRRGTGQRRPRPQRTSRERRARLLAWSVVLLPVAALIIVGVMIAGERGTPTKAGTQSRQSNGASAPVKIAGAVSFDPEGDHTEHADQVANAFDGDPATFWETEGYDVGTLSQLGKSGVGLVLTLPAPANVTAVRITTNLPGWHVRVYAADQPAPQIDGWRAVSSDTPVRSDAQIDVNMDGKPARYLLLWVTSLAIDVERADKFRARIGEVAVLAATRP